MKKMILALCIISLISSCERSRKGHWTDSDKNKFNNECQKELRSVIDDKSIRKRFCDCTLEKVEDKYDSYNDLDKRGTEEAGEKLGRECATSMIDK